MAESMSLSPALDPGSPYYVHPDYQSDENLPMVKLSEDHDNYFIWKIHFLDLLRSKNKVGFVDGTVGMPDHSSPLHKPWSVCNARVQCWLMNSVSEELRGYVRYAETAHKAWEDLRMIFVPSVDLKIYELRQRIATLRQDGDPVARYFEKLGRAWAELSEYDPVPECACGGCRCEIARRAKEAREKELCYAFMMGLNNGLSYVRTELRLMNPPPSLNKAYAICCSSRIDDEKCCRLKNLGSRDDDHHHILSVIF